MTEEELAKATAQAKRVEELSEALRRIADGTSGKWVSLSLGEMRSIAAKALEGSAKA